MRTARRPISTSSERDDLPANNNNNHSKYQYQFKQMISYELIRANPHVCSMMHMTWISHASMDDTYSSLTRRMHSPFQCYCHAFTVAFLIDHKMIALNCWREDWRHSIEPKFLIKLFSPLIRAVRVSVQRPNHIILWFEIIQRKVDFVGCLGIHFNLRWIKKSISFGVSK